MSSSHEHDKAESPNEAKAVVSLLVLALAGVACCLGVAAAPLDDKMYVFFAGASFGFGYMLGFESLWIEQVKPIKVRILITVAIPVLVTTCTFLIGWWLKLPEGPSALIMNVVGISSAIIGFAITQLIQYFFRRNN